MNPAFKIWLRALWIYALFVFPALFNPAVYLVALGLALCCGLPALPVFAAWLWLVWKLKPGTQSAALCLALTGALLASAGCAFLACFWLLRGDVLDSTLGWLYLFPLAAAVAAAVSVFSYHRSIFRYVNPHHHANSFPKAA